MRVEEKERVRGKLKQKQHSSREKVEGESRLLEDFKDGNFEKAAVMRGNYSE